MMFKQFQDRMGQKHCKWRSVRLNVPPVKDYRLSAYAGPDADMEILC